MLRGENPAPPAHAAIDGAGGLLPGLIDAHGHVMGLGFGALQLDLTGTTSLADLQQRLKAYAAANPATGWILGRGWNQELWADKNSRPPPTSTRWSATGRCGWAGSMAMPRSATARR